MGETFKSTFRFTARREVSLWKSSANAALGGKELCFSFRIRESCKSKTKTLTQPMVSQRASNIMLALLGTADPSVRFKEMGLTNRSASQRNFVISRGTLADARGSPTLAKLPN